MKTNSFFVTENLAKWFKYQRFLFLAILFFSSIVLVKAQPNPATIPNPYTDASIISGNATYKLSLYGASGKYTNTTFSNAYDISSFTDFGNSNAGIVFTPVADKNGALRLTFTPAITIQSNQKYIYFVCSKNINNYISVNGAANSFATRIGTYKDIPGVNDWQLAVIDITDLAGSTLTSLTWQGKPNAGATYVANIVLTDLAYRDPTLPTTYVTPPDRISGSYLSLFSDKYNTPAGAGTFAKVYGDVSTSSGIVVAGQNVQKMVFNDAASSAIRYELTNYQDVSAYSYLHLDIYPLTEIAEKKLGLVFYRNGGADANSSSYAYPKSIPAGSTGGWTGIDIPLSDIVKPGSELNLTQFKTMRFTNPGGLTYYVDNIYFYFPTAPNAAPTDDGSNIRTSIVVPIYGKYATAEGLATTVDSWSSVTDYPDPNDGNVSKVIALSSTASSIQIKSANQADLLVTAEGETNALRMNVFVSPMNTSTTLTVALNGVSYSVPAASLQKGAWNTIVIRKSEFPGVDKNLSSIAFTGTGTVYIDNLFFYIDSTPIDAAPMPTSSTNPMVYSAYSDRTGNAAVDYKNKSISTNTTYNTLTDLSNVLPNDRMLRVACEVSPLDPYAYIARLDVAFDPAENLPATYQKLHFAFRSDIPIAANQFRVRLYYEDGTDTGQAGEIGDIFLPAMPNANTWYSHIIDISNYKKPTTPITKVLIVQAANTAKPFVFYVDNIMFYTPSEPNAAPEATNYPLDEVVPIYGQYVVPGYGLTTKANQDWDTNTPNYVADGNTSKKIDLFEETWDASTIEIINQAGIFEAPNGVMTNTLYFNVWVAQENTDFRILLNNDYMDTGYVVSSPAKPLAVGQWHTIKIPLSKLPTIVDNSLADILFLGSGTVYIDNMFFFNEIGNLDYVAEVNGTQYYSIYDAYMDNYESTTGTLKIELIANSNESTTTTIDPAIATFSELIICPKDGAYTVTYTGNNTTMFYIHGMADDKKITFDGRIGASESGTPRSLTFIGKAGTASIISMHKGGNLIVQHCMFKGTATDTRPKGVLNLSGSNSEILNNYFEDCMFLGEVESPYNGDANVISIYSASGVSSKRWKIRNNHFYETGDDAKNFTQPTYRRYIRFSPQIDGLYDTDDNRSEITGNVIGGSGRDGNGKITGTMRFGSDVAGVESSHFLPIDISLGWPQVDIPESAYILIADNEIANISVVSPTFKFYNSDDTSKSVISLPDFTAILSYDGNVAVTGNKIHDLTHRCRGGNEPIEDSKFFLGGIRTLMGGGNGSFICEENTVYNLDASFIDDTVQKAIICGIMGQIGNSATDPYYANVYGKGIIRNNHVIIGFDSEDKKMGISTFAAIIVRIHRMAQATQTGQIDVHDNIVVINKFIAPHSSDDSSQGDYVMDASGISLGVFNAEENEGNRIINCYNNIAVVQPKAQDAFKNLHTVVSGIKLLPDNENAAINVFHNTALVQDLNSSGIDDIAISAAFHFLSSKIGKLNIFNNNFVNNNAGGSAFYYGQDAEDENGIDFKKSPAVYLDYNNYYAQEKSEGLQGFVFSSYNINNGVITSYNFDEWKFDYFDKSLDHNLYSLAQNPKFSDASLNAITYENIQDLKTSLQPKRFIGGRKVDDTLLSSLLDHRSDSDNTNTDIAGDVRNPYHPTIGALNTDFPNYWTGTVDTNWGNPSNWSNNKIPSANDDEKGVIEIVFAPSPAIPGLPATCVNNLALDQDRTVTHIYNDTEYLLDLNGKALTVTGGIWLESPTDNTSTNTTKIDARKTGSTIVYNGAENSGTDEIQHIFPNTFVENQVYNLTLNNKSNYFVLLHDKLEILNTFAITNPNATDPHIGALNCIRYNTELKFSGGTDQVIPQYAIYNNEVYDLVVNSGKLVTNHDNLFVRNNLSINATKKFEIPAGKLVKVDGLTTNDGGTAGLTIKARTSESETTPNATFIFNPTLNNSSKKVAATVEMFSPAKNNNGEYRWQFFTVPVEETVQAQQIAYGAWIRRWDPEATNRYSYYGTPYWIYLENTHTLSPVQGQANYTLPGRYDKPDYPNTKTSYAMQGYEITMETPRVLSFTGNLLNSDFTLTLKNYEYTGDEGSGSGEDWDDEQDSREGEYVVGNPYTAAIDISKLDFTGTESTVYIYTTGSQDEWKNQTDQGSSSEIGGGKNPGQYYSIPQNLAGTAGIDRTISSMQGFVVKTSADNIDGTFSMKYGTAIDALNVEKNAQKQRSAKKTLPYTIIDLESEHYNDRVWIFLNDECKKGFDNGWDGRKFVNLQGAAQLFTIENENDRFQVSTMDSINNTYLGIKSGSMDSKYTLTFNHVGMDDEYNSMILHDLVDNETVDIKNSGTTYSFTETNSENIARRFLISTEQGGSTSDNKDSDDDAGLIKLYVNGKTIFIENEQSVPCTMYLYDITGKRMLTRVIKANTQTNIETELSAGSYIVKIVSAESNINQSIILK